MTQTLTKTLGFPRMHKEAGERRDFLPDLFAGLASFSDRRFLLEGGYGSGLGFSREHYLAANQRIEFVDRKTPYLQDLVVVLRAPTEEEIAWMQPGAALLSMLHYETRETRNQLLQRQGLACYSMDGLVDDQGARMVVNFPGTARAGARVAFNALKERMPDFHSPQRGPINVTFLGIGKVAQHAAKAFEDLSDKEFLEAQPEVSGLVLRMLPRTVTRDPKILRAMLVDTDILVDASMRLDPSRFIVPNELVADLPPHAVILDLTADPYNELLTPIQVKGIEGTPTGTLDQYIIEPDDEAAYAAVPRSISSKQRRLVVSCNAWPGVDAEECMATYGIQLLPFLRVMLRKELGSLSLASEDPYERALVRGSLSQYLREA